MQVLDHYHQRTVGRPLAEHHRQQVGATPRQQPRILIAAGAEILGYLCGRRRRQADRRAPSDDSAPQVHLQNSRRRQRQQIMEDPSEQSSFVLDRLAIDVDLPPPRRRQLAPQLGDDVGLPRPRRCDQQGEGRGLSSPPAADVGEQVGARLSLARERDIRQAKVLELEIVEEARLDRDLRRRLDRYLEVGGRPLVPSRRPEVVDQSRDIASCEQPLPLLAAGVRVTVRCAQAVRPHLQATGEGPAAVVDSQLHVEIHRPAVAGNDRMARQACPLVRRREAEPTCHLEQRPRDGGRCCSRRRRAQRGRPCHRR